MEERVKRVLARINEDILTYNGNNLFESGILDSLKAVNLVAELEDEFDIDINAKYVTEDNFKTKETIIALVESLVGNNN